MKFKDWSGVRWTIQEEMSKSESVPSLHLTHPLPGKMCSSYTPDTNHNQGYLKAKMTFSSVCEYPQLWTFLTLRNCRPGLRTLTMSPPQVLQTLWPSCLHLVVSLAEPSTVFLSAWQVKSQRERDWNDFLNSNSWTVLKLQVQKERKINLTVYNPADNPYTQCNLFYIVDFLHLF